MTQILQIAQLGDPVLRETAQAIPNVQEEWVQILIDQLMATLSHSNGVGIAAPQVGYSHQLLIVASRPNVRYPNAPQMEPIAMINPCLIAQSHEQTTDWEGCLSVPGLRAPVPRCHEIEVSYTTREGKLKQQVLTGFIARIFQHELDHLKGLVFLDHINTPEQVITDQEYLKRITPQP